MTPLTLMTHISQELAIENDARRKLLINDIASWRNNGKMRVSASWSEGPA
jgi:hypothetical protein